MRLGKASIPPRTKLEDGEAIEHQFPCPFTRLTLTDRRIIFSTPGLGDRGDQYDEVTRVEGGFSAGDNGTRENATVAYGIYIRYGDQEREAWAWIPNPKLAKLIISQRSIANSAGSDQLIRPLPEPPDRLGVSSRRRSRMPRLSRQATAIARPILGVLRILCTEARHSYYPPLNDA